MAIFKDRTGRGEVTYAKAPLAKNIDFNAAVQKQQEIDYYGIFYDDIRDVSGKLVYFPTHTVFQLRGERSEVVDVSANKHSIPVLSLIHI